jgi:hypothetical protein
MARNRPERLSSYYTFTDYIWLIEEEVSKISLQPFSDLLPSHQVLPPILPPLENVYWGEYH